MPPRIRELWTGWHPGERRWLRAFRDAVRRKYADVVMHVVLFGSIIGHPRRRKRRINT